MEKKNFFKSVSFKCILTLLIIVLVSGILLTICNALFYVSDSEKLQRAFSKLYSGETVEYKEMELDSSVSTSNSTVNSIYQITTYDGDYLLNVTGEGGYSNGTVTCWIIVQVKDGKVNGIKNATISENKNQSFIQNITASHIQQVIDQQKASDFTTYSNSGITTGATFSLGAIANALNGAYSYVSQAVVKAALLYTDYSYNKYIADPQTEITVSGETVTYKVITTSLDYAGAFTINITVGADKKIATYAIEKNGSTSGFSENMLADIETVITGKSLTEIQAYLSANTDANGAFQVADSSEIKTNATRSNYLCFYSAAFALANYDKAKVDFAEGGNN